MDAIDAGAADPVPSGITAAEAFSLHSKPGAANVLFIDVDGHEISGTAWNGTVDRFYATAFDSDGDGSSFSATEIDQIAEIWHRIAEDFSAFDVDVTTEDPGSFGPTVGHVLITPNVDATGRPMPSSGAGGVAYVNVFGESYYEYYSPALVYSNNLGEFPPYIAEAASHEAGHNLGLGHDGTSTSGYYSGHGSGATSWGPIMGTGYNDNVSQWSRGEYADANNTQDDIAIMTGTLGARPDDHADGTAGATPLEIGGDGSIAATTPESDPFGTFTANKGVIGTRTDTDWFGFAAGAGPAELRVTPSWAAWPRSSGGRGTNLDVEVTLVDANGDLVARAEPTDETDALITVTLAAGDYYLGIAGVGNATSPYDDYGSQGQYFIDGSVTPDDGEPPPVDNTAPTPDPMSFASAPAALDDSRITMTANAATDDSGAAVEYYFASPTGPDSGWIGGTSYTATGLAAATAYDWQVKARDAAGNETAYSLVSSATTDDAPVAPEPPLAIDDLTVTDNADGSATLGWSDVVGETRYEVYREAWHTKRERWRSRTLVATLAEDASTHVDASGNGLFRYFVRSANAAGGADSALDRAGPGVGKPVTRGAARSPRPWTLETGFMYGDTDLSVIGAVLGCRRLRRRRTVRRRRAHRPDSGRYRRRCPADVPRRAEAGRRRARPMAITAKPGPDESFRRSIECATRASHSDRRSDPERRACRGNGPADACRPSPPSSRRCRSSRCRKRSAPRPPERCGGSDTHPISGPT